MTVAHFPKAVRAPKVGDILRAERLSHPGHSQRYAAAATGYTREQWSNWERGVCDPGLEALRSIFGLYPAIREKVFTLILPPGM